MARRCDFTRKGVQAGNNVSHANNKTRRRFLPNIHDTSLYSDALDEMVQVRISTHGLRTVEHNGGLDAFLTGTPDRKLGPDAIKVKRRVEKAKKKREARESAEQPAA
ncbi:large subunit ribosomal protein L28 [Limimonas halophila]|uniref:Large ribosomal subunit protein bL28 n=1 Tax=Limimonas halophila TaxID=1082479 RepID=A0A1G7L601_9PROT|nr:50S ribosomal protein L28 [Limimonas halophila]SDF44764.1 large subunit ribosomal protein L28 [Limimonas halophila]